MIDNIMFHGFLDQNLNYKTLYDQGKISKEQIEEMIKDEQAILNGEKPTGDMPGTMAALAVGKFERTAKFLHLQSYESFHKNK